MRYRILWLLAQVVVRLQMRLTVTHTERVPRSGAVLLVSNHVGLLDPVVIGLQLRRPIHILTKAELFEWPLVGWLARQAGAVAIRRGASDRIAMRNILKLLEEQCCVLVFPEGTYRYMPEPSAMLPVKTGTALLAWQSHATIVPIAVWGVERVWSPARGWRIWQRPPVHVVFGEPYSLPPITEQPTKAAMHDIAEDMARRIAAMLPPAYRGVYATADDARIEVS